MPWSKRRSRLVLAVGTVLAILTILGVWIVRRLPPGALFRYMETEAVVAFILASDVPDDAETRLVAMVRGEDFHDVTVPFVYYLYELYGVRYASEPGELAGLAYAEPPPTAAPVDVPELSELLLHSGVLRKHVSTALRLFDALFLHIKPGAAGEDVRHRFDDAAYADVKAILRATVADMVARSDDALSHEAEQNEYAAALEELLADDARTTCTSCPTCMTPTARAP